MEDRNTVICGCEMCMKEKLYFAINRWNLTELKTIYENTNKAIYAAISKEYGPVILEERLLPGMVLRQEEVLTKRIEAFETVFRQIHQVAEEDPKGNSYLDWLENICQFCIDNNIDKKITRKAKLARGICDEMFEDVVLLISDVFNYPMEDIKKVYFMEAILANVWHIEDGENINIAEIELATKMLEY